MPSSSGTSSWASRSSRSSGPRWPPGPRPTVRPSTSPRSRSPSTADSRPRIRPRSRRLPPASSNVSERPVRPPSLQWPGVFERSAVMTSSVIVDGARTPIGRFGGGFKDVPAARLGAAAIREALARSGVAPDRVDYVIMGHVIQAGTGQITARQAAIAAGVPKEVPAVTINKVCLSAMNAIALADQLIRAGEVEVVVAGGMESMSQAPYLLPKARDGLRLGHAELVDSMIHDGLWSTFTKMTMGESSDRVNAELGISREEQDAWAARSHHRADQAWGAGRMADEVVAVEVPGSGIDPTSVDRDEGIRPDTTAEGLARLRPAFGEGGTITAGNASQISDGAAAVVVTSREKAD